jgi:hypothetical protein
MRKTMLILFILFLWGLLVGNAPAVEKQKIFTYDFQSNGVREEKPPYTVEPDVYWLEPTFATGFGEWTFKGIAKKRIAKETLEIGVGLYLTDELKSPGKEGNVMVIYTNPITGQKGSNLLFLRNVGGYHTLGSLTIPKDFVDESGSLRVRVERAEDMPYHIGLKSNLVWLLEPEWVFEAESTTEIILSPTAYTPLKGRYGYAYEGERYYRMGFDAFFLYFPREEIEALEKETTSFLGVDVKWKLIEEYNLRPALGVGFTGIYPLLKRPIYMKGKLFGGMYLVSSKSFFNLINVNLGIMKGSALDIFTYIPASVVNPKFNAAGRNMIFAGAKVKVNSWFSLKGENFYSPKGGKVYSSGAICITTLGEHLSFNLTIAHSNLNEGRSFESFLLTRAKL